MSQLYTVGQIGKLHKVPLSDVYHWAKDIRHQLGILGRKQGFVLIPDDPHHRKGFPQKLVDMYPEIPEESILMEIMSDFTRNESEHGYEVPSA